jgi:hypothetical protein
MRPEDQAKIGHLPVQPPGETRGWVVGQPPLERSEEARPGFADALAAEQAMLQRREADKIAQAQPSPELLQVRPLPGFGTLVEPQRAPGVARAGDDSQSVQDAIHRARLFAPADSEP